MSNKLAKTEIHTFFEQAFKNFKLTLSDGFRGTETFQFFLGGINLHYLGKLSPLELVERIRPFEVEPGTS